MYSARVLASLALFFFFGGCAVWDHGAQVDYRTVPADPHHDANEACRKHKRALESMEKGDLLNAERLLNKALVADVTFGPAHNNLGQLYFQQRNLYLAAWEFQYARQLMPERPEPDNNLALVMESVGRLDEAVQFYEMANAKQPQNAEYLGNLVRARIKVGERSPEIVQLLQQLVFIDTRPDWMKWAEEQLVLGKLPTDVPAQQLEILPPPSNAAPRVKPQRASDMWDAGPPDVLTEPEPELLPPQTRRDSRTMRRLPPALNLPNDWGPEVVPAAFDFPMERASSSELFGK